MENKWNLLSVIIILLSPVDSNVLFMNLAMYWREQYVTLLSTKDTNALFMTLLSTEDNNVLFMTLLSTEDSNSLCLIAIYWR